MSNKFLSSVSALALDEMRDRSQKSIYQTDFIAWQADILGIRTYDMMAEIANIALFGEKNRTAIKSSNGTSKSWTVASMIAWWVSVFPLGEALAIVSAPTVPQIERVTFNYLKNFYNMASMRGVRLPGEINESLEWKYLMPTGSKGLLAFGKKPTDSDIVSSFQGTRPAKGDRTLVAIDEAGGVHPDLFTAAEAVATGESARVFAIGNPDRRGTEFFKIFTDDKYNEDWNKFTISTFDLPTYTGERVYDNDADQKRMIKGLTGPAWVEQKRRIWGEGTARWQSKVLGEFPGEDDNTFFGQEAIDKAINHEVEGYADVPLYLGCDIARYGQDDTVVYSNQGGRIRFVDRWSKSDNIATARRIHKIALEMGATEVRVDAAGTGSGVFDALQVLDEFATATYNLIGIVGGDGSPDYAQWAQARSWHYDMFRKGMQEGVIDLDITDDNPNLKEELVNQTFRFNQRGALQVTPKDEMRKAGGESPDDLDAAIYSFIPVGQVYEDEDKVVEVDLNMYTTQFDHFYASTMW